MKIGLSLGMNRYDLLSTVSFIKNQKLIDYLELYIPPMIKPVDIELWRKEKFEYCLHAPHNERAEYNDVFILLATTIARKMKATRVIFNAGIDDSVHFNKYKKDKAIPETMPYCTSFGDRGAFSKPEEVYGDFCLDFVHAFITAQLIHKDYKKLIQSFLKKKPSHFHISDVDQNTFDKVVPFGKGNLPIDWILSVIPDNAYLTLEVDHTAPYYEKRLVDDIVALNLAYEKIKKAG